MNTRRKMRDLRSKAGFLLVWMVALTSLGVWFCFPAEAAKSWFSRVETLDRYTGMAVAPSAVGDDATTVFDVVISLHNDPTGDDDPAVDGAGEEQTAYENVIRRWADAICEQSNGAHKLRKVRIFRNGKQSKIADVVWNASEWPRANVSGFGTDGLRIMFGDVFPNGCGTGCDKNMLADPEGAGYTLGHEWGHYVYGLFDEYRGSAASGGITVPLSSDTPVTPAIMNSQWNAVGGNFEWLNHSTSNNYQANTAQGRVYGASCWEVLIQEQGADPRDGDRSALPVRTRYTALVGNEPTAADSWIKEELPGAEATCRDQLEIIWMEEDLEMQVVVDSSGSMYGTPLDNAKLAAKTLVDVVTDGSTALGVIDFNTDVSQIFPITAIPDPGGAAVKTLIKAAIDAIVSTGVTSMFDAAGLALDNLLAYKAANSTKSNQVVFLLSDGEDNDSVLTQGDVTAAYQAAQVPLITFGYGYYAPTGVLRQLADDTGGLFFSSPTTLAEIQQAFLAATALVSNAVTLDSGTASAPAGGAPVDRSFVVDSTLDAFKVVASYDGGLGEVGLTILDPSGADSGVAFTCSAGGTSTSCTAEVNAATVAARGRGTWSVRSTSVSGSLEEISLVVIATPGAATRTYDVTVAALNGISISYPEPIVLTATVSKGTPITGVNMTALVTDPLGTVTTIPMNDAGLEGDARSGDGIYSAIIGYETDGTYKVEVWIDNAALTAAYTMESFQPAHLSAGTDGTTPVGVAMIPITENFTRTTTTQLTVDGVLSDDHPDSAPGTSMTASNTDVAGRIDRTGDVDFFQINSVDTSQDLIIRVSNLSLGMRPLLNVYRSDGSTLVASGTLTTAASERGYVLLRIPAASLDSSGIMAASVQDQSATASQGTYSFSAGRRTATDAQSAIRGTVGSIFTVTGSGFSPNSARPKVYALVGSKRVSARVVSFSNTSLTIWWTKNVPAGDYELIVAPKKSTPVSVGTFSMMAPSVSQILPTAATVGTSIQLSGLYFGSKTPKLAFQNLSTGARFRGRVQQSSMDSSTGASTLSCQVPNKATPGSYAVIVTQNGVGEGSITFTVQ